MIKFCRLSAIGWVLFSCSAYAVEFNKLSDKSSVGFTYRQMNVPVEGSFKRFTGSLAFDPAKPESGKANLNIDLNSIDTGASDADEEVKGKLWFDTKTFPQAQFSSIAIKNIAPGRFEARGRLSIKGRSREVIAPVNFRTEGATGIFEGSITIKRADFGIGEGIWADFGTVANEIQIKFRIVATSDSSRN